MSSLGSELKRVFMDQTNRLLSSRLLNIYGVWKLLPEEVTNMATWYDFDLTTTHPHLESEPGFRYFVVYKVR